MAKLLKLRFLDATDKDNQTFVTVFTDGKHKGFFKREPKDIVAKSAEGTSCRHQKGLLTEVRTLGGSWRQIDEADFKLLLNDVNVMREHKGWQPVELPAYEEASD